MTPYETKQISAIEAWKREKPGVVGEVFDSVTAPLTWLATQVIPVALLKKTIEGANVVAQYASDAEPIARRGGVASIDALRAKDLRLSDRLAEDTHNLAIALSGSSGAVLGATGVGGIALDIATLITLSLRTIHRIGLCYGYERLNEQLVLGILALSTAGNRDERHASIELLHDIEVIALDEVWEDLAKDALLKSAARSGAFFTARRLSRRVGRNLAQRKAVQLVPVVGAVLSGATNICFVRDVGWAARRVFQERWLIDNGQLPARPQAKEKKK